MDNPARLLADIFDVWAVPRNERTESREKAFADARGLERGVDVLPLAMRCVLDLEIWLERLAGAGVDVDVYLKKLPDWQRAVVSRPRGVSQQSQEAAPQKMREDLRMLAPLLDTHAAVFQPDQEALGKIEAAVTQIKHDIVDLALDPATQAYVLALLDKIVVALHSGDKAALRSRLAEFVGWADLSEEATPDPDRKKKFRDLRNQLVYPIAAGVTTNVVTAAVTAFLTLGGGA